MTGLKVGFVGATWIILTGLITFLENTDQSTLEFGVGMSINLFVFPALVAVLISVVARNYLGSIFSMSCFAGTFSYFFGAIFLQVLFMGFALFRSETVDFGFNEIISIRNLVSGLAVGSFVGLAYSIKLPKNLKK